MTHGSHGCINMKYDDAAKLYDLINETTPIICHF
ncbi:MAG: L,D-transpeptidase [Sellimonas intestinalis]